MHCTLSRWRQLLHFTAVENVTHLDRHLHFAKVACCWMFSANQSTHRGIDVLRLNFKNSPRPVLKESVKNSLYGIALNLFMVVCVIFIVWKAPHESINTFLFSSFSSLVYDSIFYINLIFQ